MFETKLRDLVKIYEKLRGISFTKETGLNERILGDSGDRMRDLYSASLMQNANWKDRNSNCHYVTEKLSIGGGQDRLNNSVKWKWLMPYLVKLANLVPTCGWEGGINLEKSNLWNYKIKQ